MKTDFDVAVVGGGPAGLIAAVLLAQTGARTVLIAPRSAQPDPRTTALLGPSVHILQDAGIWDGIAAHTAPLRKLRLVDGTRRLVRSPEVLFDAGELGLEAFGYNVDNEVLLGALRANLSGLGNLEVLESPASTIELQPGGAQILCAGKTLTAKLIIAADGRNSLCRQAAGIRTNKRSLPQAAIALNLRHSRSHHDTSTEFHTEGGPFTLVPLPGKRSSLVWVCTPKEAERIRTATDEALALEIERKSHSLLGAIEIGGPRGIFPLGIEIAERFAGNRVALVGEAGHVLPPIGAQGLNLGIRDADVIARRVGAAMAIGEDPGAGPVLEAYDLERRADTRTRTLAVEMLGRSLISGFLPVHLARGLGLEVASRIPFLRRSLMRTGLGSVSR